MPDPHIPQPGGAVVRILDLDPRRCWLRPVHVSPVNLDVVIPVGRPRAGHITAVSQAHARGHVRAVMIRQRQAGLCPLPVRLTLYHQGDRRLAVFIPWVQPAVVQHCPIQDSGPPGSLGAVQRKVQVHPIRPADVLSGQQKGPLDIPHLLNHS